jgi:hypothetical protein
MKTLSAAILVLAILPVAGTSAQDNASLVTSQANQPKLSLATPVPRMPTRSDIIRVGSCDIKCADGSSASNTCSNGLSCSCNCNGGNAHCGGCQ